MMDEQENPLERDHCLSVVLPGGMEKNTTVHGSKPVMDLLVTLCASYHLNPSDYTVEVLSPNRNNIGFKPNSPIGSLEAEKIVLKPRSVEEKTRRPYMPEASVRLLINYNKSHKTVVRVNPRVPLEMLLPVVCDKCEFNSKTTVLLRDSQSKEPLDLTKSLNEHDLRELFARDTAEVQDQPRTPEPAVTPTEVISPPPLQDLPKRAKKQKENAGFLNLFRRGKKKPEPEVAGSLPASPGLNKQVNGRDASPLKTHPPDMPKKRRAPQPPMSASQSVPSGLGTCHLRATPRSAESTLRSTKRRAPPPPSANTNQEVQADTEVKASLNAVEELRESDESDSLSSSSSSSPHPSQPWPSSSSSSSRPSFAHLREAADPYLPSFRGRDLSDARCALAKVMTSSVSKGVLVRRLRNSTTFPKFYNSSTFMSTRGSDNGVFCAEPVLTANLPTEPEWEDPVQRRGMTTFKVVPSMKEKCHDPERSLDLPDPITAEREASPRVGRSQTETEEDPCSPDRSETETPDPSSQETHTASLHSDTQDCPGSPLAEVEDSLGQQKEEDEPEVTSEVSDGELGSLPPPLDLDIQDCPGSPPAEVGGTIEKPKEEDELEVTPEVTPASPSDCSDGESASLPAPLDLDHQDCPGSPRSEVEEPQEEDEPEVASEAPSDCSDGELLSDLQINSEDQNEFPQSPSRQSVSPDMDHRGSCADEREAEEEEEEDDEDSFPPPPPPVFFEDMDAVEEWRDVTTSATEQSAAAPSALDKMMAAPSKFAQAVALAVQRSRLQRGGKVVGPQDPKGPDDALPSTHRSIYQYGA